MGPAHGSRVWVHYGITAHPHGDITRSAALVLFPPTARAYGSITASRRTHSSTVQNRSGTPFRYAAVHENLTGSQESRVARAYVHILRIYQRLYIDVCTRTERSWTTACVHFFARSLK